MKQFNLDEYLDNPNRKVVTRDGRSARIVCVDAKGECPVVAMVLSLDGTLETPHNYTKNGYFNNNAYECTYDLLFAPERKEGWINLYKNDIGHIYTGSVFDSKEEAEEYLSIKDFLATIKIEWEE